MSNSAVLDRLVDDTIRQGNLAMRYVCLIYFDPRKVFDGSPTSNAMLVAASTHNQSLSAKGQLVFAQPLALPDEAMTVQVRDGSLSATDGPFLETKDMLGGLVVIEAPDLNAAVQIAGGLPFATLGSIEVRPVPDDSKPRPVL
ncbi:YciI family protein [Dyella sp. BiH032]|uniref:YciI family protein n=1 Tax=Dyella sp. BiH032 TaxID=3075430 RepID=UPI002892E95B|nr:YciI family protein [Dyella sp. BiH032]WNL46444.1 YciI family protein [Dyella sp. BiH032]